MIDKIMNICLNNKLIFWLEKNEKMKKIIEPFRDKEFFIHILKYIIAGVLTTIVSIGGFWLLFKFSGLNENICNFISIVIAIIFAYVINRKYVFESKEKNIIKELSKFVASRAVSSLFDMVTFFILVTLLKFNELLIKILINVVVMIMNYILSRIIVFKKKD